MNEIVNLINIVSHQLDNIFMTNFSMNQPKVFEDAVEEAVRHTKICIKNMRVGGGSKDEEVIINPLHANIYCAFLYWMSHYLSEQGKKEFADQVYYLNKSLNCVELYHEVKLPLIWFCEHPLGSVLGRANYGDYFFFYQGCTVGGNFKSDGSIIYPTIGSHVKMLSNSKVIGDCHIGNNVIISANCYIKDTDIPDDTIVFGQYPNIVLKKNDFRKSAVYDNILIK